MRITQWGECGILCMQFIANECANGAESVSAVQISEANHIDIQYTQQVLHKLRKADLLLSSRGAQGGYYLTKKPSEITLYDILKACEGETFEIICESKPVKSEYCAVDYSCALQPIWYRLREHIDSFLVSVKLSDLLSESSEILQLTQIKTFSQHNDS